MRCAGGLIDKYYLQERISSMPLPNSAIRLETVFIVPFETLEDLELRVLGTIVNTLVTNRASSLAQSVILQRVYQNRFADI